MYPRPSPSNHPTIEKLTLNEEEEEGELDEKWAKLKVKHKEGGKVD